MVYYRIIVVFDYIAKRSPERNENTNTNEKVNPLLLAIHNQQ